MKLVSEPEIYDYISKEELDGLKGVGYTDCVNTLLERGYEKDAAETIGAFVYAKNKSAE